MIIAEGEKSEKPRRGDIVLPHLEFLLQVDRYPSLYLDHSSTKSIKTMIIVHDIFNCKPGNASKLAKMFKEVMSGRKEFVQLLTDVTGPYNKVVIVTQFENLAAYDKSWETTSPEEMKKMEEAMKGYT